MRASHLSLVSNPAPAFLDAAPRPARAQGAAAFLEGLDHVMRQAREIAESADQPADLRVICADFVSRNADVGENLGKVAWLSFARAGAEDDEEFRLEPFIGA